MTVRHDELPFICLPGDKPTTTWGCSWCFSRWKIRPVLSVFIFLLLPLFTTYRSSSQHSHHQNYYLVMGETPPRAADAYRSSSSTAAASAGAYSAEGCLNLRNQSDSYPSMLKQTSQAAQNTNNEEAPMCFVLKDTKSIQHICNQNNRTKYHNNIQQQNNNQQTHRLHFCSWRTVQNSILLDLRKVDNKTFLTNQRTCLQMESPTSCTKCLEEMLAKDETVRSRYLEHQSKLSRYDCKKHYSMWWSPGCVNCTVRL